MYADYAFYTGSYYGTQIASTDWNRLATRASDFIDYITLGHAAAFVTANPNETAVKKCCCALAERYQIIETAREQVAANGDLQSESVGSYSRSFRSSAETAQTEDAEMKSLAHQYLLPTGLLYRGIGR